ncbi:hypothetical protein XELAEV_18003124mg [Xenopus laevis]|nr:hypothetical protein XELAEV_18003124mg [Xenopus laevis]
MALTDLRDELSCSICLSIYTDPVMLTCGHNFCRGCIENIMDAQERSGAYSCPECRQEFKERPALQRNRALGNIAEHIHPAQPEPGETGIDCFYCDSPISAVKSCLQCEASFCNKHLRMHSKSVKHVLIEPTMHLGNRKCSVHKELLKYYCWEESVCVCVSCCLAGEHRGHRVELLSEASEKKKETLRKVVEKLRPEREETERGAQRLQERRREVAEKAAGETERVTALFRDIREQLEALEKRLLSDISSQKEKLSLTLTDLMEQLEIKKDELSRKIRHIEELCNMADPLTVLQERESHAFCGAEGADNEARERDDTDDLDVGFITETLLTGIADMVPGLKHWCIYGQEVVGMILDRNTSSSQVTISNDMKIVSKLASSHRILEIPDRFETEQALSTKSFPSGRHYWEVEVSESGGWGVGVTYPSIEKKGRPSWVGYNNLSWCLYRVGHQYKVIHGGYEIPLYQKPSCRRLKISLDYEVGRLSFYELSEPISHLHTITAKFTEPLHAAFWVGMGRIRIMNGTWKNSVQQEGKAGSTEESHPICNRVVHVFK